MRWLSEKLLLAQHPRSARLDGRGRRLLASPVALNLASQRRATGAVMVQAVADKVTM
jgi:hypothetical protein